MTGPTWRSSGLLAWTEHDGPRRPPSGPPRWLLVPLAAGLAAVFTGIMATDTLCPEHRAWVQGLASVSLVGAGLAITGLLRGWASAVPLTALTAGIGVAIGIIDATHDPVRGRLIALGFAAVALLAAVASWWHVRLLRWERRHVQPLVTPEASQGDVPATAAQAPAPVTEAGARTDDTPAASPAPTPAGPARSER
jgi:hypothetical protein